MQQHHYRWECPQSAYETTETCDFCMCYRCKTDFSKHGCLAVSHRFAAPPNLDLWPAPPSDGEHASVQIDDTAFSVLDSAVLPVSKHPGPKCAGVPVLAVRAYLRHAADGSVVHLLNAHELASCKTQPYFDLLRSLKPTVTKPMIGNLQKPPPGSDQMLVCTAHIRGSELHVTAYARRGSPWLELRPEKSLQLFHAKPLKFSVQPASQPKDLLPFQAKLLQRMMAHEATSIIACTATDILHLSIAEDSAHSAIT
jgi:hypothetical protein